MHDVAVGDHVGFALEPHLAHLLRAGLAAERYVVVVGDGLGPNEAALEIGMDDRRRLRRLGPAADGPGRRLLAPGGHISDHLAPRIPGPPHPAPPPPLHPPRPPPSPPLPPPHPPHLPP